jgi:hypothetical protein
MIWAPWQRRLLPGSVPESLLQHFGIDARFLLSLPLLIVAEASVDATLRRLLPQFVARGLVDDALRPAFRGSLEAARRLRSSRLALVGMLAALRGGQRDALRAERAARAGAGRDRLGASSRVPVFATQIPLRKVVAKLLSPLIGL